MVIDVVTSASGNAVKQPRHVFDAGDVDTFATDFSQRAIRVRVIAHPGVGISNAVDSPVCPSTLTEVFESPVRVYQPANMRIVHLASVHRLVNAARIRILSKPYGDLFVRTHILRSVVADYEQDAGPWSHAAGFRRVIIARLLCLAGSVNTDQRRASQNLLTFLRLNGSALAGSQLDLALQVCSS